MNTTVPLTFLSTSVADTLTLGSALGALLRRGDIVLLAGDLGAGKTHISKGIVAGTGCTDLVTSPTFVFINEYHTPAQLTIFHVDLYRIESSAALDSIGLADATAGSGICLIEWAERDPSLYEIPHLQIMLRHHTETSRLIQLSGGGPRTTALIHALQQQPPLTIYQGDSV
jgi:tRNA threonylcarbamoyladenosine biosynthesis protein TsaE